MPVEGSGGTIRVTGLISGQRITPGYDPGRLLVGTALGRCGGNSEVVVPAGSLGTAGAGLAAMEPPAGLAFLKRSAMEPDPSPEPPKPNPLAPPATPTTLRLVAMIRVRKRPKTVRGRLGFPWSVQTPAAMVNTVRMAVLIMSSAAASMWRRSNSAASPDCRQNEIVSAGPRWRGSTAFGSSPAPSIPASRGTRMGVGRSTG